MQTSGAGLIGLVFEMNVYNENWDTPLTTYPIQAGKKINLGLSLNSTQKLLSNMQFAIKKCFVTQESNVTYTLFDTSISCDNAQIDLDLSFSSGMWKIQHILFLIGSDSTSSYTMSCDVVVCDTNMPPADNECASIIDSCG